jgi:hypothetical protein
MLVSRTVAQKYIFFYIKHISLSFCQKNGLGVARKVAWSNTYPVSGRWNGFLTQLNLDNGLGMRSSNTPIPIIVDNRIRVPN